MTSQRSPEVRQKLVRRQEVRRILADLGTEPGLSLTIRALLPGAWPGDEWAWLPRSANGSETGLVLISGQTPPSPPAPKLALAPPFPLAEDGSWSTTGPFESELDRPWTVAIILLRLGHYAFGIAENERLVVSKAGGRYVKNRQRQGGQSAMRFQRNREVWIQQLFNEVTEVATSRINTYARPIDWLVFGGDRVVISRFKSALSLPDGLHERSLPWQVPVERPGRAELERAVVSSWSYRVWAPPV